jgi:hypothetical protein
LGLQITCHAVSKNLDPTGNENVKKYPGKTKLVEKHAKYDRKDKDVWSICNLIFFHDVPRIKKKSAKREDVYSTLNI